ncbi:CBS domain-containing protein [Lewinellaceae bacterium SD302]|nr:CBS domain-containing protein [Lewinellaceae bacterium SD302]
MGEERVNVPREEDKADFIRHLLRDVQALEYMLQNDWFETEPIRIGAEQEMCLVDKTTLKPAPIAIDVLKKLEGHEWATTEIAQFNLENNFSPREFTGSALHEMETENIQQMKIVRKAVKATGGQVVLTGILPTIRKFDLDLNNLTPKPRYRALIDAINSQLEKSSYELNLAGIDELLLRHDSPLLEALNTSYQVHLQVTPATFVPLYNIAQAVTAPVMAIAANSPIVFGKRLWHESRIALFQQALDVRNSRDHMRERAPRVNFGNRWLDNSILEIYREDIARFRVLLGTEIEEDSLKMIAEKKTPKLKALQVHNGTVYRWNRPCYGISPNGQPHLRIENRVLPAGPTILDQTANAAFWLGLVTGMAHEYKDIRQHLSWSDVRDNFFKAAKFGIDTKFTWFNDKKVTCCDLIQEELLPLAKRGLESRGIISQDIDRYLGVIEERTKKHTNGARWQLRVYTKLREDLNQDEALSTLTASIIKNQATERPVHTWKEPNKDDYKRYRPKGLRVEEFMETDLFTVHQDDLLDLVVDMMDWRKLRYLPVEDKSGSIIGLVTTRKLLRYFTKIKRAAELGEVKEAVYVKDIMINDPVCIDPKSTIKDAMAIMRERKIGCLPVTKNNELMGIITEMDFLRVSGRLIERLG